ncbi:nuclear transport factor 2 family protein [Dehalococcoides mccartyi]|nr:nuclear transport factor 2 family protein [Dehalococcoides mccartyi]
MADDRAIILELEERYAAAINASDVMEFDDLFAEDAMLMLPDRPAVNGREAIVSHQREFFRSIKATIKSIVAEVEILDSIVYVRGAFNYGMAPKMGGEAVMMRGKYINLYKLDEMKQWRIWRSINNIDHPHDD